MHYADSVITLYNMSDDERAAYFEEYIAGLKLAAEKAAQEKEDRANTGFAQFAESKGGKENKGKFYFYNITSLGYGKTEFQNRWGQRELEDDWRWSNKAKTLSVQDPQALTAATDSTATEALTDEQKYSVDFYVDRIPTEQTVIDSLQKERNFANYQLGLIYKEKIQGEPPGRR